jgi:hypothetical protein
MKRKIYTVLALAAILMSASCAKEDPAKPIDYSAPEKQATIQGKLLINTNETLPIENQRYSAISGITIKATVSYSSLSGNFSQRGGFTTTTTTNSQGEFTLQVPATEDGVSVSFTVNPKDGRKTVIAGYTSTNTPITKEQSGFWSFYIPQQNSVKPGQIIIIPLTTITVSFAEDVKVNDPVPNF